MKNIKISPFFIPVFLITLLLKMHERYLISFLALFFHEAGHLVAIKRKEIKISYIKIEPFGINIRLKDSFIKNPNEEIFVALMGPVFNFILCVPEFFFKKDIYGFFFFSNLSLGIFNLLPLYPLDGGRILRAFLSEKKGYIRSLKTVLNLTRIFSVFLFISGVLVLFITGFNISLCVISCFLYFNLFSEREKGQLFILRELSSYKEKNKEIEKIPIKYIAVNKDLRLRKILYDLSFLSYHIFSVIEEGKIIGTVTEGEVIECLLKKGSKCKIYDLLY